MEASKFDKKPIIEELKTNSKTDKSIKQTNDYPASQRKCVIEGKRFIITRHFVGDKNLNSILMNIATNRANKDMGL